MNVCYFKDKIPDELYGAKEYIKRAIEIRLMNPSWAKDLVEMSSAELEHATKLYKMFQEYYSKLKDLYKEIPEYIQDAHKEITEEYTKCSVEIKYLHEMFRQ